MKILFLKVVFSFGILLILASCGTTAESRAIEFTSNVYAGIAMKPDDWLTIEGQKSRLFSHFGGMEALVRQSKSEADRNGGVKSIRVINIEKKDGKEFIETEVTFQNGEKTIGRDTWQKEGGRWKITP